MVTEGGSEAPVGHACSYYYANELSCVAIAYTNTYMCLDLACVYTDTDGAPQAHTAQGLYPRAASNCRQHFTELL